MRKCRAALLPPLSLLLVGLVVSLAVAVTPASADKPGPTSTSASLTVLPNPVLAYGRIYYVLGSGFQPDEWVYFSTTCAGSFNRYADSSGKVLMARTSGYPGTCRYDAYQYSGHQLGLMATRTFSVVAQ